MSSLHGVAAVQEAMRVDLTPTFLSGPGTDPLSYLSVPNLITIGGGDFLKQILLAIVDPPFFLNAFVETFKTYKLDEQGQIAFAWLLFQLVKSTGDDSAYFILARDPSVIDRPLSSTIEDVRVSGEMIRHVAQTRMVGDFGSAEYSPGGRHDNDKTDF